MRSTSGGVVRAPSSWAAGRGGRASRACSPTAATTVTLATRHAEDAQAIRETGRNPRFDATVDLTRHRRDDDRGGAGRTTPSSSSSPCRAARSARSSQSLPGDAPVLSLTKGLDPETGERLSTLVRGRPVAVLSGPNMAEEVAAGLRARR